MDPLSISASGIAIIGAVIASCKAVHGLGRNFKNAPKEIRHLVTECNELQAILSDITAANKIRPSPSTDSDAAPIAFSAALADHIKKAEEILQNLTEVKDSLCHVPAGEAAESRFRRIGWLKQKNKVKLLLRDMHELKLSFGALLTSRTLFHVSTLDAALKRLESSSTKGQQDAMLLLERILDGRTYTTAVLEVLPSALVDETGHVLILPDVPEHDPEDIKTSPVAEEPLPILSTPIAIVAEENHSIVDLHVEGTSTTIPFDLAAGNISLQNLGAGILGNRVRTALLSSSHCKCKCHDLRVSATPRVFAKTFGRLVVGISGQIFSNSVCDLVSCNDQSHYALTLTYYFPSWFVARAIIFRCVQKPNGSPQFSLQTRDLLPEHSPLINAITAGNVESISTIFSNRVCSPNAMEPMGWTGLTWAIHRNEIEACKFLLVAGADPLLQDGFGNSAIDYAWLAVFEQHVAPRTLSYLKESFLRGSHEEVEKYELTHIHQIVLGLLDQNLDKELSEATYVMINKPDAFGKTALLWASRRGDLPTVLTLLRHGADANIADQMKRSPLHMAARSRSVDVIKALIKYGGNVHAENFLNETPAHYAAYEADVGLLEPFVDANLDINKPSKYGRTLLDIAVQWNLADTVQYLISKGARIEGSQPADYTMRPLGRAIFYHSSQALAALLDSGSDTAFMDGTGNTIFHLLAQHGSEEILKIFEDSAGAKYLGDYPDDHGKTAMDYAKEREDDEFLHAFTRFMDGAIGSATNIEEKQEQRKDQ